MTQAELIQALGTRGYSKVTVRGLTNWRAKGLLPPLTKQGKGRGRGVDQFWEQPDILDRAIAVCEFMRQHCRTETALLRLWFAGFDVKAELIRSAWLKALDRDLTWIKRKSDSRADPEAVFTSMASAVAKKSDFGIDRHAAIDTVTEVLRAYHDEAYRLEIDAVFEPVTTLIESVLTSKNPALDLTDVISERNVVEFFSLMQNVLSLGAKRLLIESTTDVELRQAHGIWVRIIGVISSFFQLTNITLYDPNNPDRFAFAITFGGIVIHAILLANRLDLYENIRKTPDNVEAVANRNLASNRILERGANPLDVYSEEEKISIEQQWETIWSEVDFRELLNRLIRDKTLTLKG